MCPLRYLSTAAFSMILTSTCNAYPAYFFCTLGTKIPKEKKSRLPRQSQVRRIVPLARLESHDVIRSSESPFRHNIISLSPAVRTLMPMVDRAT